MNADPVVRWRLRQEAWNYGFATEGAKRCLQFGFDVLHLPEVYSFTSALNKRSENVMQKIGMQKEGEFEHPGIEIGHRLRTHVLYKKL
jgi:RimJ/RimL family protein N-acetyltransferase